MTHSHRPPEATVSIHLLRHADAGDPEAWTGPDDARPLSPRGVRQAERLGRYLSSVRFSTDAIITSPKLRALQTAEIVGRSLGVEARLDQALAGHVSLQAVSRILESAGSPSSPILVGHDPDFTDLLTTLVDARAVPMKKGAIARVDLSYGIEPGGGVLRWLLPPDLLPRRA